MNNKEFISELAQRSGYTQADTQRMASTVIEALGKMMDEGRAVNVPGLGTFDVKKRMERIMVNPSTQQRMLVPPKLVMVFRPVAAIKQTLKRGEDMP